MLSFSFLNIPSNYFVFNVQAYGFWAAENVLTGIKGLIIIKWAHKIYLPF